MIWNLERGALGKLERSALGKLVCPGGRRLVLEATIGERHRDVVCGEHGGPAVHHRIGKVVGAGLEGLLLWLLHRGYAAGGLGRL